MRAGPYLYSVQWHYDFEGINHKGLLSAMENQHLHTTLADQTAVDSVTREHTSHLE
jgi:hypothetical protein